MSAGDPVFWQCDITYERTPEDVLMRVISEALRNARLHQAAEVRVFQYWLGRAEEQV